MPTPTQSATPLASEAPSDATSDIGSTQPTTPSSAVPPSVELAQRTPTQPKAHRATKSVIPAVPILPHSPAAKRTHRDSVVSAASKSSSHAGTAGTQDSAASPSATEAPETASDSVPVVTPPAAPKSWADLVRSQTLKSAPSGSAAQLAAQMSNGVGGSKTESLSEVLNDINTSEIEPATKVALLEPRGLVNTGNMCYMNSVSPMLLMDLVIINGCRFSKFWFFAYLSTTSFTSFPFAHLTVSKVIHL